MKKIKKFAEEVAEVIRREYSLHVSNVEVKEVVKNNDTTFVAITYKVPNSNLSPCIYMEDFYNHYNGDYAYIYDVAKRIVIKEVLNLPQFYLDGMVNFNKIKDKVVPVIINKDRNKEYLKDKIYTPFLDLAIIYKIILNTDWTQSTIVTESLFNYWGIDKQTLHEEAVKNLPEAEIHSMASLLRDFAEFPDEDIDDDFPMKVITNDKKISGVSSVLLNNEFLRSLYEDMGKFIILPSSIHEVIVIPAGKRIDEGKFLADTVKDVNESVVSDEDFLSNSVYLFDGHLTILN